MTFLKTSSVVICCFSLLPVFGQRYPKRVCCVDEPTDYQELESTNTSVSSSDNLYTYLNKINTAFGTPYAKYTIRDIATLDVAAAHFQRIGSNTPRVITINKSSFESKADNAADREALLIWILAHEVSHHVHGDMGFDDRIEANNLIKEILADQRAGYAVGKTTNVDITFFDNLLPKILSNIKHTSTHPARRYRILAAKSGWLQAKMENVNDGATKIIGGKTYEKVLESDGDRSLGEVSNGTWNGISFDTYNDGDIYIGNYQNGLKNAYGLFLYKNGKSDFSSIYFGAWNNDKKSGQGTLYFINGNKYRGEFRDNDYNGKGNFYWLDGTRYEGEWESDNKSGYGVVYYPNGRIYQGLWKNDHRHGTGVLYQGTTVIQSGCWRNGDYVGETCN